MNPLTIDPAKLTSSIRWPSRQIDEAIELYSRASRGGAARCKAQVATLNRYKRQYLGILRRLSRRGSTNYMVSLAITSWAGRVLALLRADTKRGYHRDLIRIERIAARIDCWAPCTEPVTGRWIADGSGKPRLLGIPGVRRTAMSLMVRDVLSALGVDSELDFARNGGGGEREYIRGITNKMVQGFKFWATPDVSNFYLSVRPGHLQELPINDRLICNVAFLNEETPIKVKFLVAEIGKIKDAIRSKYPEMVDPHSPMGIMSIRSITAQALRQGLIPGSVLSPLLARWFLSEAVKGAGLGDHLHVQSYVDDLAIGGKTKIAVEVGVNTLTGYLSQHPAGAIFMHGTEVQHRKKVTALGYRLQHGNGHGKNPVHVKPGAKRLERFRRKLQATLATAQMSSLDIIDAGLKYWSRWYGSQKAWTKVPGHTLGLSENITLSYIADFASGLQCHQWQGSFFNAAEC